MKTLTFTARAALWLAAVALCLLPAAALAHAELVSAQPAPGSTMPLAVSRVTLTFSEALGEASQIAIYTPEFQQVAGVTTLVLGTELRANIEPPLGPGTYTVQWTAASTDGHTTEGSYQFAVSAEPPEGGSLGGRISVIAGVIAGFVLLGLVGVWAWRRRQT